MTATTGMAQEKHPNIVIEGLRKIHDDQASEPTLFKVELQSFAVDAPISEIWTRLEGTYAPKSVAGSILTI